MISTFYHAVANRFVVPEGAPVTTARAWALSAVVSAAGVACPYLSRAQARIATTKGLQTIAFSVVDTEGVVVYAHSHRSARERIGSGGTANPGAEDVDTRCKDVDDRAIARE